MQVINGSGTMTIEAADFITTVVDMPELRDKVYQVLAAYLYIRPTTAIPVDFAMIGSVAINARTAIDYEDVYKDDVIVRRGMRIGYAGSVTNHNGFGYEIFDPANMIDPVAPYFADTMNLHFVQLNDLVTSGTIEYAYQLYLEQVKSSKNVLDDLFKRRYTPTS